MKYTEEQSKLIYDFLVALQDRGVTSIDSAIDEINDNTIWSIWSVYGYGHYDDYLRSPEWKALRQRVIERDGAECVICGSRNNLRVHHTSYEKGVDEEGDNLVTLCEECHKKVHEIVDRTFSPRTGEGDVLNAAQNELGRRMADIINDVFPEGIEGRRKVRTVQVIRNTYRNKPHRVMPASTPIYQAVKKRK